MIKPLNISKEAFNIIIAKNSSIWNIIIKLFKIRRNF
jgi:hypothetical protein